MLTQCWTENWQLKVGKETWASLNSSAQNAAAAAKNANKILGVLRKDAENKPENVKPYICIHILNTVQSYFHILRRQIRANAEKTNWDD